MSRYLSYAITVSNSTEPEVPGPSLTADIPGPRRRLETGGSTRSHDLLVIRGRYRG